MILKWGSYAHADSEVTVSISKEKRYNDQGAQTGYLERWEIAGYLQADTQADLTAAILALEAAYATNGRDLVLYLSDGTTATAHRLLNGVSNTGTRVAAIRYPEGSGAEYSTFRRYQIVVEADVQFTGGDTPTLALFNETVTIVGGGPRKVWLETLRGAPIVQVLRLYTTVKVTQTGSLRGFAWLPPPPPLLPAANEHLDRRRIERATPAVGSLGLLEYPVSWTYEFETTGNVSGLLPNLSN